MPSGAGAPCCDCTDHCLNPGPDPANASWELTVSGMPTGDDADCADWNGSYTLPWFQTTSSSVCKVSGTHYGYRKLGTLPTAGTNYSIVFQIRHINVSQGINCRCVLNFQTGSPHANLLWRASLIDGLWYCWNSATDPDPSDCCGSDGAAFPGTIFLTRVDP